MHRQMGSILQEKHLDFVQFSVRFVDAIPPNPRTGKKPLIAPYGQMERKEAV